MTRAARGSRDRRERREKRAYRVHRYVPLSVPVRRLFGSFNASVWVDVAGFADLRDALSAPPYCGAGGCGSFEFSSLTMMMIMVCSEGVLSR